MSFARKSSFNLDEYYDNLKRIQSSLGKTGTRNTASSLTKPSPCRESEDNKRNSLMNFKKELHCKGLTKGKIKIQRNYEKSKMSHATEYENKLNQSDNFIFSDYRDEFEDPYDKVKAKLVCWKRSDCDDLSEQLNSKERSPQMMRTATIGYLLGEDPENKQNIQNGRSEMKFPTFQEPQPSCDTVNNNLLCQLTKRNDIYYQVHKGLKIDSSQSSKGKVEVSLQLQNHFRKHATMKKIIGQFKNICGLQINDLEQLYSFLKMGAGKESRARFSLYTDESDC